MYIQFTTCSSFKHTEGIQPALIMKTIAFLIVLVAATMAIPVPQDVRPGVVPVLQRTEVRDEAGQFSLSYLSGDGTTFSEQGALKPTADGSDLVLVKQGSVRYTSPEGLPISLTYVADELGFRPEGSHLPVAPRPVQPTF